MTGGALMLIVSVAGALHNCGVALSHTIYCKVVEMPLTPEAGEYLIMVPLLITVAVPDPGA